MKKNYKVKNLDCANCARKLEEKLSKINGVNECRVSFMNQKIILDVNDENATEILEEVLKTCKKAQPDMQVLGD